MRSLLEHLRVGPDSGSHAMSVPLLQAACFRLINSIANANGLVHTGLRYVSGQN